MKLLLQVLLSMLLFTQPFLSLYLFAASSTLIKRNKDGKMLSKLSFKTKEDYNVIEVMKY